jgi:hypothetical protein
MPRKTGGSSVTAAYTRHPGLLTALDLADDVLAVGAVVEADREHARGLGGLDRVIADEASSFKHLRDAHLHA